jgi:hypothetical protein
MRKWKAASLTAVAGAIALMGVTAPEGHANAAGASAGALSAEVVTTLNKMKATHDLTPADRAVLRKHPEVAAQILDPASATVSETVRPVALRGITCNTYNRYIAYSTILGAKAFDWHHEIYICPKGAKGVHRVSRRQYVANRDANFYLRTPQQNDEVGQDTQWYSSAYTGVVENCVIHYGCLGEVYPYSKFVVNGGTGHVDYYFRKG